MTSDRKLWSSLPTVCTAVWDSAIPGSLPNRWLHWSQPRAERSVWENCKHAENYHYYLYRCKICMDIMMLLLQMLRHFTRIFWFWRVYINVKRKNLKYWLFLKQILMKTKDLVQSVSLWKIFHVWKFDFNRMYSIKVILCNVEILLKCIIKFYLIWDQTSLHWLCDML